MPSVASCSSAASTSTLAAYPLVPKDEVGFRIQVTAANTDEQITGLIHMLGDLADRFALQPRDDRRLRRPGARGMSRRRGIDRLPSVDRRISGWPPSPRACTSSYRGSRAAARSSTSSPGSSFVAILIGIRIHRPAAPWVWRWFAIGQALFFLGDVYTYSYPLLIGHEVPFPSAGDVLYLLVYPALMTGVLLAVRRRNPQGDRAGVIDALIITVGIALLSWVFLMAPYVHDATLSPLAKSVSIAYPLGDVLLLAAALRLAFDGGRRRGSFFLLAASVGALLTTDAAYGYALLDGTYNHQLIYDVRVARLLPPLGRGRPASVHARSSSRRRPTASAGCPGSGSAC